VRCDSSVVVAGLDPAIQKAAMQRACASSPGMTKEKMDSTMTQTDKLLSRKEAGVGFVIFNNPERHNAVSLEMWEATTGALATFAEDDEVRVVVLTGAGGKAFVSGADISKFASERASLEATRAYDVKTAAAFNSIYEFPKPTIAMIRGYCIGGGVGLASCCDLRICSDNSRFAVPAAKLGLGYAYAGLKRLVDIVGQSFAKEIFYTARQFDAQEAYAMGLVNRVVPQADLEAYVRSITDMICANAPLTIKAAKFAIGEILKDESKRDVARVDKMVEACFGSNDYVEGRTAFMEKRKPAFTGK
jgi:enoyl-CoA hydratase/carnithine racemase